MTTKPNPKPAEHAADFLLRFRPAGRVNLAAMAPDVAGVEGHNFTLPAEAVVMREWIDARNGIKNLYFCVNEPRPDAPHTKLRKEHIGAIHAVYTDHDPKGGPAELHAERERLNKQARELSASAHKPSYILNSGGGMQYIWALDAPLTVTQETQDAAEAQGRGLALKLGGGDAVQNIDRLMRLPNTWNLPDEKKRKKGRAKAIARVFATGARYNLPQLAEFAPPAAAPQGTGGNERVAIVGLDWTAAELIPDLDDLPSAVRLKLDAAISQDATLAKLWTGEKTQGDTSRSGFDASIIAVLKRLQFTPTEAAQILRAYPHGKGAELTERDFKRVWLRSPVKTAAEEFDTVPPSDDAKSVGHPIEQLNKEHAYVASVNAILWERPAGPEFLKIEAFHNKYAPHKLDGKPLSKLWMESKRRRDYDDVVFMPGQKAPPRSFNYWRGFAYEPAPSMAWGTPRARAAVDAWTEHLRENVARGNEDHARWIIGWLAHMVQRPWEKPLTALVLRGGKGVGKGAPLDRVRDLFPAHSMSTAKRKLLIGEFTAHLKKLVFFVLDECFWSGDKEAEGVLKDLITGNQHNINEKHVNIYPVANLTRIAIIGNEDWLVPSSADERRYAVFDVGDGRKQNRAFFKEMREGMEADDGAGYRLLLRYLLDFNLAAVDVNEAPSTQALLDQKHLSLDPFRQWWFDCLSEGQILGGDFSGEWPAEVETERLRRTFQRHMRDRNVHSRMPTAEQMGKMLRTCAQITSRRARREGARVYVYPFPPLNECRKTWENYIGGAVEWADNEPADAK